MVTEAGSSLDANVAPALVAGARLIAERLSAGGRLLAHGVGRCAADAQHIAVEFLHPVITGRRALPALVGAAGRTPGDVVVSVAYGGEPVAGDADVLLTDHAGAHTTGTQVVVSLPGSVAKEAAVVAYHVLWEVAHVFLDAGVPEDGAAPQVDPAMSSLYPMLYASSGTGDGDQEELEEAALASVRAKLAESAVVRAQARYDNANAIDRAVGALRDAPTVFTCGNGGSATDAADLAHLFGERGRSLSGDIATVTALSNDVNFEVTFARPLATLGRPGDAVVGISTSGSSPNVLAALARAKSDGLAAVGLSGYGGGSMVDADLDALLVVRSDSVHRIQEAQVGLYSEVAARCG